MIDKWTMALAKRDFEIGRLSGFSIERALIDSGWSVVLRASNSNGPLVDARLHQPRVFKTLDAAVLALESIGFKVNFLR